MKKIILLTSLTILLSACETTGQGKELATPVQVPELPAKLDRKFDQLPQMSNPSLGGIIVDLSETTVKYNDVAFNNNRLVDFYKCVRASTNDRKKIDECLKNIK